MRVLKHAALMLGLTTLLTFAGGCENWFSQLNMTIQPKYKPYAQSAFFHNDGASRQLMLDTVARVPAHDGHVPRVDKAQLARIQPTHPPKIDMGLIQRGKGRFDIWCTPCHGRDGYGDGIVAEHGYPNPPSYHIARLRNAPDEHFYDVITNGIGVMPAYGQFVSKPDRWAIIAYIRALQLSQHAPLEDAPQAERRKLLAAGLVPARSATSRGATQPRRGAKQPNPGILQPHTARGGGR